MKIWRLKTHIYNIVSSSCMLVCLDVYFDSFLLLMCIEYLDVSGYVYVEEEV